MLDLLPDTPALPGTDARPGPATLTRPVATGNAASRGMAVRVVVRCDSACAGSARLLLDRGTASRLKTRGARPVARVPIRLAAAGSRHVTLRVPKAMRARARKAGMRKVAGRVLATVTDGAGQTGSLDKRLRLRP